MKQETKFIRFPSKELIVAIVVGFVIGLVITYGAWTANQAIKQKETSISPIPTEVVEKQKDNADTKNQAEKLKLVLGQPEENFLSNSDAILVSGSTLPNANVFIYGEDDEQIVVANQDGQFSAEIGLLKGINYLTVTTVNDSGEQKTVKRTIVYTTLDL